MSADLDIGSTRSRGSSTSPTGAASVGAQAARPLPVALAPGVVLWVATIYFAEGLPYSLVHQVSSQLFTDMGASAGVVGLLSLYGLAWNFKFVMGPIVDGFGSLRRWVIALEVLLALTVLALIVPVGLNNATVVGVGFGVLAILAATHDVAVDGFYIAALDGPTQASLSGARVAAYRAAMFAASGGLVVLAGLTSYRVSLLVGAIALGGLASFQAWSLPGATAPREARQHGPLAAMISVIRDAAREPHIAVTLIFLLTYRAGDALMFAMNAPFLSSLGLDTTVRGLLQGIVGTSFSIGGAVLGGIVISRRGLARTLSPIAILQSTAIALYIVLAMFRLPVVVIGALIAAEQLIAGIGTAGLMVFILERSRGGEKATRFAIATAIMSLASTLAGATSGFLVQAVGYPLFFVVALAASWPGVLLSFRVPKAAAAVA